VNRQTGIPSVGDLIARIDTAPNDTPIRAATTGRPVTQTDSARVITVSAVDEADVEDDEDDEDDESWLAPHPAPRTASAKAAAATGNLACGDAVRPRDTRVPLTEATSRA
jgi:hypothetical protein